MGRIVFLLILAGLGYYAYTNGLYYYAMHNGAPEPGRECEVVGPLKSGLYLMYAKSDMKFPVDAHIGTAGQKLESVRALEAVARAGAGIHLDDNTKVRVLESSTITLYGVKQPVVKVQLVGGDNDGTLGWVERGDVIDNPVQQVFQAMRGTTAPKTGRGGMTGGGYSN